MLQGIGMGSVVLAPFNINDTVRVIGRDSVSTLSEWGKLKVIKTIEFNNNRQMWFATTTDEHAFWLYELKIEQGDWDG